MYTHMLKQRRKVLGTGFWGTKLVARIRTADAAGTKKKDL